MMFQVVMNFWRSTEFSPGLCNIPWLHVLKMIMCHDYGLDFDGADGHLSPTAVSRYSTDAWGITRDWPRVRSFWSSTKHDSWHPRIHETKEINPKWLNRYFLFAVGTSNTSIYLVASLWPVISFWKRFFSSFFSSFQNCSTGFRRLDSILVFQHQRSPSRDGSVDKQGTCCAWSECSSPLGWDGCAVAVVGRTSNAPCARWPLRKDDGVNWWNNSIGFLEGKKRSSFWKKVWRSWISCNFMDFFQLGGFSSRTITRKKIQSLGCFSTTGWSRSRILWPKMVGPSFLGSASLWWTLCAPEPSSLRGKDRRWYDVLYILCRFVLYTCSIWIFICDWSCCKLHMRHLGHWSLFL